jgi:hypothetical protein
MANDANAHIVGPLAPDAQATHKAVTSGAWSNPATWGGQLPGNDARVIIPSGIVVTVDQEFSTSLFWVRVDGTLTFASNVDTQLTADTIFVNHGGRLEIGTAQEPIQADKTARLTFSARNGESIDHSWDPLEFSRGLIAESPIEIHGAPKTAWVSVTDIPDAGATMLQLDDTPSGWRTGDTLVLTAPNYDEDEVFWIVSINDKTVTLDQPVSYSRVLPKSGLALHVANLTRNVQIASGQSGTKLQGHVMLMESGHEVRYAGFYDLGRTTVKSVTDPIIVNGARDPSLMPDCGVTEENVRGRYALHFHMAGPGSEKSVVEGNVVSVARGSRLKVGFINHSSNVAFKRNVAYQIDGAHFMTEEGDEVGEFEENLAIHSEGSGLSKDMQGDEPCNKTKYPEVFNRRRLDVAHRGHGFWIHAGGVEVTRNVSTAHGSSNFEIWPRPLNYPKKSNTYLVQFKTGLLSNGAWANSKQEIGIDFVPAVFRDNTAYVTRGKKSGRNAALSIHFIGIKQKQTFPTSPKSLISDFTGWNVQNGVISSYSGWIRFEDIDLMVGTVDRKVTKGMQLGTQGGNNMDLVNVFVSGFSNTVKVGKDTTCLNVIADGAEVACSGAAIQKSGEEDESEEGGDDEPTVPGDRPTGGGGGGSPGTKPGRS